MRGLGMIVSRLTEARRTMRTEIANDAGRLDVMTGFGANPGELDARVYVPNETPTALVVVLHGCTQSASVYDHGSGWSTLAERHGFAVLFPQQRRTNNPNLCFNWYLPCDARRGRGEAASISQMIRHMAREYRLDRSHVFITGLSAGGAMTSVMLACYPELFASGAIIAGLPFASATTLPQALERMRGQGAPTRAELSARARAAANQPVDLPTLSVWHGTRDAIVSSINAGEIVDQWRDLHGLGAAVGHVEFIEGHRREVWRDDQGLDIIERYDVQGMGHGTPLNTHDGEACGTAGPHMLEARICSTRRIAAFWGLTDQIPNRHVDWSPVERPPRKLEASPVSQRAGGVGVVIEDALRAAGLMQ